MVIGLIIVDIAMSKPGWNLRIPHPTPLVVRKILQMGGANLRIIGVTERVRKMATKTDFQVL